MKSIFFLVVGFILGSLFYGTYPCRAAEPIIFDRDFITTTISLNTATAFDMETTFAGINNGRAKEGNPFMRPFVERGQATAYVYELAMNTLIMYAAYKMRTSENTFLREHWRFLPRVAMIGHIIAGGANLRFVL